MSRTASSFGELTVASGKSKCPVMIAFFPEVTQQLAERTLESHGSSGDITLKLVHRAPQLSISKCLLSSWAVLFKSFVHVVPSFSLKKLL